MGAKAPLRIAIAGLGNMGTQHVQTVASLKRFELAGICDADPGCLERAGAFTTAPRYREYGTMLDRETPDAVLVASREKSQDVKNIVAQLGREQRGEQVLHRKVHRPWGWYDGIDQGPRHQVKRIMVKPGASLSLQMHHHRAEHWIVVTGTAEVTVGDKVLLLAENQSTYIPLGARHRLRNPGKVPLEIIEVQSGSYLGEDDIVRFEDIYGREGTTK